MRIFGKTIAATCFILFHEVLDLADMGDPLQVMGMLVLFLGGCAALTIDG